MMLLLDWISYVLIIGQSLEQLTAATNIPGHKIVTNNIHNIITIDGLRGCYFRIVYHIVLHIVLKKKSKWFMFEKCQKNVHLLLKWLIS